MPRTNAFANGVPFGLPVISRHRARPADLGKALVPACNGLGILIDLSHLNEQGFWDVAARTTRPLVATHSAAHAISPPRNLTDQQLAAIRDSDGLVG